MVLNNLSATLKTFITFSLQVKLIATRLAWITSDNELYSIVCVSTELLIMNFSVLREIYFIAYSLFCQLDPMMQSATFAPKTFSILESILPASMFKSPASMFWRLIFSLNGSYSSSWITSICFAYMSDISACVFLPVIALLSST